MVSKRENQIQLDLLSQQKIEIQKVSKNTSLEALRVAEEKLFADSLAVIEPVMRFAELGFDEQGEVDMDAIPFDWECLPVQEKMKKIRLAKAGWMPSGDIPHAIKIAHATIIGIIKARAQENSGTKILNIEAATFPAPSLADTNTYEVLDISDE